MDKINFIAKDNFPFSTNAADLMQNQTFLASQLALISGVNYILSGCKEDKSGNVSDGVIVIDGEVLPFISSIKKEKITVYQTTQKLTAFGVEYPEAYIFRIAQFSDTGEYNWNDFALVTTYAEIKRIIDGFKGDAPGTVKEWGGLTTKIPEDYLLCDGRDLSIFEYPELFDAIVFSFGGAGSVFKFPDCRGRFTVGYDNSKDDYKEIGLKGGFETITLTESQLPEHKHIVPWGENLNTSWTPEWGFPPNYFNDHRGYKADTDNDNTWSYTSPIGENKPHENRPPFIVFAKIIKAR